MSDAARKGSWVVPFVERAMQGVDRPMPVRSASAHLAYAGGVATSYMQGGALGALLGATHAKFGLDAMGFPLDGMLGGLGAIVAIGATFAGAPDIASWALRRGEDAFAIYTFRKGYELVHGSELHSTAGSVDRVAASKTTTQAPAEDRIERVAREIE